MSEVLMRDKMSNNINDTLRQRDNQYGGFAEGARVMQALKEVMRGTDNWDGLPEHMKEALEMITHKIGRILNGDPNYIDSWHDIAGYSTLIEQELKK